MRSEVPAGPTGADGGGPEHGPGRRVARRPLPGLPWPPERRCPVRTDDDLYGVFRRLVEVQTELWNAVDARLRERHDVPLAHVTVLRVVAETEDCRVQDVVAALHLTVGGASKAVDRLVAAGHADRTANPGDRRSSILTPTPAGLGLLGTVEPDITAVLEDRLGGALPPDALAVLGRTLRTLQERPRQVAP